MQLFVILNLLAFCRRRTYPSSMFLGMIDGIMAMLMLAQSSIEEGRIVKGVGSKITTADDVEVAARLPSIQVHLDAGVSVIKASVLVTN